MVYVNCRDRSCTASQNKVIVLYDICDFNKAYSCEASLIFAVAQRLDIDESSIACAISKDAHAVLHSTFWKRKLTFLLTHRSTLRKRYVESKGNNKSKPTVRGLPFLPFRILSVLAHRWFSRIDAIFECLLVFLGCIEILLLILLFLFKKTQPSHDRPHGGDSLWRLAEPARLGA